MTTVPRDAEEEHKIFDVLKGREGELAKVRVSLSSAGAGAGQWRGRNVGVLYGWSFPR